MTRHAFAAFRRVAAALACALLAACHYGPRWILTQSVTPEQVAHALDDSGSARDFKPEDAPQLPVRTHLRPCCAFGTHLQAKFGKLPVPFFSLGNIIDIDHLGPHRYDAGAVILQSSAGREAFSQENNGLVYTCRGGFIDTAHVRDNADWTVFWATAVARASRDGATIALPDEGGKRRVVLQPLPPKLVELYGLRRVAISLAQWITFQLSIWHEIATAYGEASVELYPEYVSAFSPEDLYSDLLGAKIGGGLAMEGGSLATDAVYEQNMDQWLKAALEYLKPVPIKAGEEAAYLVDGLWWDSKIRLPDYHLVRRRNLDIGDELVPWVIPRAGPAAAIDAWMARECGGPVKPLVLHRQESIKGIKFSKLASYEIDVKTHDPFPFPRPGSTAITQDDFPAIVEDARRLAIEHLGPGADRPERAGQ